MPSDSWSRSGVSPSQTDAGPRRSVLLLLEDLGGGTGNHVCRLVSHWVSRGWHVVVVTQMPPLVRQLPAGVEVRVTKKAGWYDRFPLAQVRRLLELRRIVRELQPDVVHTYFFWSIIYGRVLKLLGYVPILVENREDMGFSWGRWDYQMLRMTSSIPQRIVCVAEAVRGVALEREGVAARATTVVRNGIDLSAPPSVGRQEARRWFGFSDEHVVVGMVANLPRAVKGGRQLLDAVRAVVAQEPNVRFFLVGVGTDPESLKPELEARGIVNEVVGAGYRRDVEDCYAAMDISVLTSSTEGLSITLLESMRSGLPTVVTNVGGNPELVVHGETGYLVEYGNADAFADRVVALARDEALRRQMGAAGRRRVMEQFGVEDVAWKYLDLYEQLIGESRGGETPNPLVSRPDLLRRQERTV